MFDDMFERRLLAILFALQVILVIAVSRCMGNSIVDTVIFALFMGNSMLLGVVLFYIFGRNKPQFYENEKDERGEEGNKKYPITENKKVEDD